MTEKLRQSLSAAIDDEADAFELRRVLDELGRDGELKALWDRYHLIGSVLRGEGARVSASLRDEVWSALESAPATAADPGDAAVPAEAAASGAGSRLGRYTGLAVAASVAFAVVIGFNGFGGDEAALPSVAGSAEPAPVVASTLPEVAPAAEVAAQVSPSDVQRTHAYMLHHAQQQALNQAGVMSFVKLATYEAP